MGLSLKLFGGFAVRDELGTTLSLRTRKMRALLAYLAVNADRPQSREQLMTLLWSDRGERQARQSLNQALSLIRKLGGDGIALLDSDHEQVTLLGKAVASDVGRFRSLLRDDPAEAAVLYDGPFLDGLSVPDPGIEDWLLETRSEFHAQACGALERAAETSGDTMAAIEFARRLAALDPLREGAHRCLMRLLHASGDRAGALRQYQACADVLKKELQVEPDAATRSLFEEIRRDAGTETVAVLPSGELDALLLPDKPSIVVLPFDHLGNDPVAGHLADGLTEDLTAALAKIPELFVAARNSAAAHKGTAVNVREVAKALCVRYVLEGSVQKSGDRLRVTPQLIDATTGHHLWAERYDRPIDDVFALQDEIVRRVVIELQVKLTEGDDARIASRGTNSLEAWLNWVQARAEARQFTREGNVRAHELFEAAHRADPNWACAVGGTANCHYWDVRYGWSASREESIARGMECAERAIAMDPEEPFSYMALRGLNLLLGNYEKALSLAKKTVSLAPNDQAAVGRLGVTLTYMAKTDRAVEVFERAARLGPFLQKNYQRVFGLALHLAGRTERAIGVLEALARQEPIYLEGLAQLAAAYAGADRLNMAKATVKDILDRDQRYTASRYLALVQFQNADHTEWLRALLVKAGLPE